MLQLFVFSSWSRKWSKAACFTTSRSGARKWTSLQLPLYCAMLDAAGDDFAAARREAISACYCVLGKSADEVAFSEPIGGEFVPEAEEVARELISRIERGVFWPPSPGREWRFDYEDWLSPSPEETVDPEWIDDQLGRVVNA